MRQRVHRASYYVMADREGRVRRPRDVLTAVVGLLLVTWAVAASDSVPEWTLSLAELVAASPQWVDALLAIGYLTSLIYVIVVIIGLVLRRRDRSGALRDVALVSVGTIAAVVALSFMVNEAWPYVLPEIDLQNPIPQFPVTRVALVTGILLVVAPYVTRPLRRLGWLAMIITAIASVALSYGSPVHAAGSVGVGMLAAGILLLVVGTPRGYPSPESVSYGLERLGVPNVDIRQVTGQDWGLVRFLAQGGDGNELEVKVHGRDSFDSQLAAKVWRTMIYREIGRTVSLTRLQAVEHEALVGLMAARAGVSVPELRAVGSASSEVALIAVDRVGVPLSDLGEDELSDELLVDIWANLARLHAANISHGQMRASSVRVTEQGALLVDLGLGSLAPEADDRAGDVVELLFSLALLVGAERAARSALEGLGQEALVEALPYLQVPAVSAVNRRRVDKPKKVVAELSEAVLAATGVEKPEPVELRRVSLRSLVAVGLVLLIGSALIPLVTGVDYAEIWDVLEGADWTLIVAALILGHTQFFPQATSTMFAVTTKLPFFPLLVLQTASQFISLAIPSSAGRVAMNAAFLHKFGVPVSAAVAQGAIDGFSGFLVQAIILVVVLLTGDVDLGLEIDPSDVPWLLVLGVIALLILIVVTVLWRVRSVRERVGPILRQAWDAFTAVLKQPSRAIGLLFSNFVYWNVMGATLWILLEAVGAPISYGSALFVAAGTSLFAGFMPIPGGVGVAEATMVALLATFGVEQSAAFAVTASYRLITFYLPALEGLFGTRWLERNDYI
jgi:glycosyltransferase 2 family protein